MQLNAIDNGADLTQMSSFQFDGANDGSDQYDYAPAGGFALLAQTIYSNWCTPTLHLN
jgi:hypothetical protein